MVNRESGWSVNRKNGQWSKSGQGVVNTAVIIRKKMQMGINVQSWQCVGGIEYIDSPVQLAKVQKWSTKRSYWINLTILNLCTNLKSASLFPLDGSDLPTITWWWKTWSLSITYWHHNCRNGLGRRSVSVKGKMVYLYIQTTNQFQFF